MVYNTQNNWVLGLFPSSGVLGNRNTTFGKLPQVKGREDTSSVEPLRKS
jgi:hypothetical protein